MEKILIKKEERVLADEHVADIARTIFAQLGGNAGMGFARVTGSKDFVRGEDAKHRPFLQFKLCNLHDYLPDQKVRPNLCRVTLNEGSDCYIVEFARFTPAHMKYYKTDDGKIGIKYTEQKCETAYINEQVYCDQLQSCFEQNTNLLLDFCKVKFG